jgi:predicted TIM-barrel fold metal-dependent hydrolase
VASGALDRHRDLRIFVAEGGASWIPALADRMDEAYRQHGMFVKPTLSALPSEIIFRQVFTSFQHDASALPTAAATGYRNLMWGSDYPHLEGTFPATQKVLAELVRDVDPGLVDRVMRENFERLFVAEPAGAPS